MSEEVIGVIEEMQNSGSNGGNWIRVAGRKYGAYDPNKAGLGSVAVGDRVAFQFNINSKNGIDYKNIQGRVTKTSAAVQDTPPPAQKSGGSNYGRRGFGEKGGFPVHPESYEICVLRRDAVKAVIDGKLYKDVQNVDFDKHIKPVADKLVAYYAGFDLLQKIDEPVADTPNEDDIPF